MADFFGCLAAECNCPPDWGTTEKCPECGFFHLRPGYCQARNKPASEAIASGRALTVEEARKLAKTPKAVDRCVDNDLSVDKVSTPPRPVDKRKEYQREWLRKKRAAQRSGG